MKLNTQLAQAVRETGATFNLVDLDQRFQALFQQLEKSGVCQRGESQPPIITRELWLKAQLVTIQKLASGEKL
jgi:hypothetical protein